MTPATFAGQILQILLIVSGIAAVLWKSARDARHVAALILTNRETFAKERATRDARLLEAIEASHQAIVAMIDSRPQFLRALIDGTQDRW